MVGDLDNATSGLEKRTRRAAVASENADEQGGMEKPSDEAGGMEKPSDEAGGMDWASMLDDDIVEDLPGLFVFVCAYLYVGV